VFVEGIVAFLHKLLNLLKRHHVLRMRSVIRPNQPPLSLGPGLASG
jgi:hypothetical protein